MIHWLILQILTKGLLCCRHCLGPGDRGGEAESLPSQSFPGPGTLQLKLGKSWANGDQLVMPRGGQAILKHTNKYGKFRQ